MAQSSDLFDLIDKLNLYEIKTTLSGTGGGMSSDDGLKTGQVFGVDGAVIDLKEEDIINNIKFLELGNSYRPTMFA